MSATTVPSPRLWVSTAAEQCLNGRDADGRVASETAWVLRRNCSLTPRQLMGVYLSLCAVSLAIAALFWSLGAKVVLAFAGLELLAVGVALLVFVRHACDRECITLAGGRVHVEHRCGGRVERHEFLSAWLRVDAPGAGRALVELTGDGRRLAIGRYVRPDLRHALARDLRHALGAAHLATAAAAPQHTGTETK